MPSQIGLMQHQIRELEAAYGPDNLHVRGLKDQLTSLERQRDRVWTAQARYWHLNRCR